MPSYADKAQRQWSDGWTASSLWRVPYSIRGPQFPRQGYLISARRASEDGEMCSSRKNVGNMMKKMSNATLEQYLFFSERG